jgi:hypothetical protein
MRWFNGSLTTVASWLVGGHGRLVNCDCTVAPGRACGAGRFVAARRHAVLDDVGVEVGLAKPPGHRHPVMAVDHVVDVAGRPHVVAGPPDAQPIELERRQRPTGRHRRGDAAMAIRQGRIVPVEEVGAQVLPPADAADDLVDGHRVQAGVGAAQQWPGRPQVAIEAPDGVGAPEQALEDVSQRVHGRVPPAGW